MTTKFQVNIKFFFLFKYETSKNFLNKFFFDTNDAHMACSGVLTLPPPKKKTSQNHNTYHPSSKKSLPQSWYFLSPPLSDPKAF